MQTYTAYYNSKIGWLEVTATEEGLLAVAFVANAPGKSVENHPCVQECVAQLDAYFRGARQTFAINLLLQGTAFQQQVWRQLRTIPYGKTASYQEIAAAIGNPNAGRAVGGANGRNPIAIIIPCHRILGRNGKLVGYGGGLWRKEWLLQHEKALMA